MGNTAAPRIELSSCLSESRIRLVDAAKFRRARSRCQRFGELDEMLD